MRILVFWMMLLLSCQISSDYEVQEIPLIDSDNSSLPFLNVLDNGTILLSYVQDVGDTSKLFLTIIEKEQGQTKKLIAQGTDWFVNWADYPITHVFPNQNTLLFHWLEKSTDATYDYDIICRKYFLDEDVLSKPFKLNDSDIPSEYGFVSSTPYNSGLQMMWLDGRNTKKEDGAMNLRTSFIEPNGLPSKSILLDERICDCCQTSIVSNNESILGFYRDRSRSEIRDVSMIRFEKEWAKPIQYSKDNWKIAGCPVNGPRSDIYNNMVAVAWHTQADSLVRNYVSFYDLKQNQELTRHQISQGQTLGRLDVKMINESTCALVWLDYYGDRSFLKYSEVNIDQGKSKTRELNKNLNTRSIGFPQLAIGEKGKYIAYTDVLEENGVKLIYLKN